MNSKLLFKDCSKLRQHREQVHSHSKDKRKGTVSKLAVNTIKVACC